MSRCHPQDKGTEHDPMRWNWPIRRILGVKSFNKDAQDLLKIINGTMPKPKVHREA